MNDQDTQRTQKSEKWTGSSGLCVVRVLVIKYL